MPKFLMKEIIADTKALTVRLGAGSGSANYLTDKETGKLVKLVAESRYNLCAAGDLIEGQIMAVEGATADDFTIGSVREAGLMEVTFDGLQATPGTGTIALGDYVVTGTVVAKDTALSGVPKVCKGTIQPFTTAPAALANVPAHLQAAAFAWRVVSLGSAGTGAVGTTGVIERVGA